MSAQAIDTSGAPLDIAFEPMQLSDLDQVVAIESSLYSFPWTAGNFRDSLHSGYSAWVLRDRQAPGGPAVIGYFLLMSAVDEAHLLNITVASGQQRRGLGLSLLNKAAETARDHRARGIMLEVRPSNQRAIAIYERYGFRRIGLRRGYYPFSATNRTDREDAIVMRMDLA